MGVKVSLLCSRSSGLVFSEAINNAPEVQEFLARAAKTGVLYPARENIKGFDEPFTVWR